MVDILDQYELRARIAPSAIVLAPVIIPVLMIPDLQSLSWLGTTFFGLIALLVTYLFSFILRHMGKAKEKRLWKTWGGAPSTQLLLEDNRTLSSNIKNSIRRKIDQDFSITIVQGSRDESQGIEDAFNLVRQRIRQMNPKGLWNRHNAEYGFLRNIWGSRELWMAISSISLAAAIVLCAIAFSVTRLLLAVLSLLLTVAVPLLHGLVLPGPLRTAAFRYAESAWLDYLSLEK